MAGMDIRSLHSVLTEVYDEEGPAKDEVSLLVNDMNVKGWMERSSGILDIIYSVGKRPNPLEGEDVNTPLPLGRPFLNPLAIATGMLADALEHFEDDDDNIPSRKSGVRWPSTEKGYEGSGQMIQKRTVRQQYLLRAYIDRAR